MIKRSGHRKDAHTCLVYNNGRPLGGGGGVQLKTTQILSASRNLFHATLISNPETWFQLCICILLLLQRLKNQCIIFSIFQCNRSIALESLFKQLTSDPIKLGWIGSGCSVATEPTAEITQYFHIPQVEHTVDFKK